MELNINKMLNDNRLTAVPIAKLPLILLSVKKWLKRFQHTVVVIAKVVLLFVASLLSFAAKSDAFEPVHYAYANYLGSGVYSTTEQKATMISLPFSYEIASEERIDYGLRLPLSLGFFDFEFADIPELDFPDKIGTITFTPGIALSYQYNKDLVIESYIDYGYAKNLTTHRGVSVHSAGISSLYSFDVNGYDNVWVNRLYYAGYSGNGYDVENSYAAIHMGLDTGLPAHYTLFGYRYQPRLFAAAFWYFNEVDFFNQEISSLMNNDNITLSNSFELGATIQFDKTIGYSWAGIERLGISYRFSENFSAFRLLFSFPI